VLTASSREALTSAVTATFRGLAPISSFPRFGQASSGAGFQGLATKGCPSRKARLETGTIGFSKHWKISRKFFQGSELFAWFLPFDFARGRQGLETEVGFWFRAHSCCAWLLWAGLSSPAWLSFGCGSRGWKAPPTKSPRPAGGVGHKRVQRKPRRRRNGRKIMGRKMGMRGRYFSAHHFSASSLEAFENRQAGRSLNRSLTRSVRSA